MTYTKLCHKNIIYVVEKHSLRVNDLITLHVIIQKHYSISVFFQHQDPQVILDVRRVALLEQHRSLLPTGHPLLPSDPVGQILQRRENRRWEPEIFVPFTGCSAGRASESLVALGRPSDLVAQTRGFLDQPRGVEAVPTELVWSKSLV